MQKESGNAEFAENATPPPGRLGKNGGRRPGWFYVSTRASAERLLNRIVNQMLVGEEVEAGGEEANERVRRRLDPQVGNACINGLKAILDSKKFTEQIELKKLEEDLIRRTKLVEEQIQKLISNGLGQGL